MFTRKQWLRAVGALSWSAALGFAGSAFCGISDSKFLALNSCSADRLSGFGTNIG